MTSCADSLQCDSPECSGVQGGESVNLKLFLIVFVLENFKISLNFQKCSQNHQLPFRVQVSTFHPTSYSPIFVYLLYIDLSPCLEGHLDPELIQVMSWIRPVVGWKLFRGSRVAVANTYTRRLARFECVVLRCKRQKRENKFLSFLVCWGSVSGFRGSKIRVWYRQ